MPRGDTVGALRQIWMEGYNEGKRRSNVVAFDPDRELGRLSDELADKELELQKLKSELQVVLPRVAQLLNGWHQDGTAWTENDKEVYLDVLSLVQTVDR